jgi:hypothetical protein
MKQRVSACSASLISQAGGISMKPESEIAVKHAFADVGEAHWVQNGAVAEVNAALLEFLDKGSLAAN